MKARTHVPVDGEFLHVHVDLEPHGRLQHHTGQLQIRVFHLVRRFTARVCERINGPEGGGEVSCTVHGPRGWTLAACLLVFRASTGRPAAPSG